MKKYSIAIEIARTVGCDRRSIHDKRPRHVASTDAENRTCSAASEIVSRFRIAYRPRLKLNCSRQNPVRTPSPTPSDAHRHRLRRHGLRRSRRPSSRYSAGDVPRYSNRTGESCRIRFWNSIRQFQNPTPLLITPNSDPTPTMSPAHDMHTHDLFARHPAPRGPHPTHLASRTPDLSPCPDGPAAIARGPNARHPGSRTASGTRFFFRAPAPQRTRTPFTGKTSCLRPQPSPQHLKQNSGANLLPNLNHSHFPACDAWAAHSPILSYPVHVRPYTPHTPGYVHTRRNLPYLIPNCEANTSWACLVLAWGTSREPHGDVTFSPFTLLRAVCGPPRTRNPVTKKGGPRSQDLEPPSIDPTSFVFAARVTISYS